MTDTGKLLAIMKKNQAHYDKWGHGTYPVWAVNVQSKPEDYQSDFLSDMDSATDAQQDRSYHIGVMNTANKVEEFFSKYFNCSLVGHPFQDCKQPLKRSLKVAPKVKNDQQNHWLDKKQLNQTGGTGVKGGHIPKAMVGT